MLPNECMAHRGWSGAAPENTLAAIYKAMAEPWISWMEIDVQLSADGVPVLIHDYTLERTTSGRGMVKDKTFRELHSLDAGSWFSERYAGEPIPSLEEVLRATSGRCRLNIELKTYGNLYPGLEKQVLDLLYRYTLQHDVFVTSFDRGSLHRVKQLAPEVTTGLIINANPPTLIEDLHEMGAEVLSIEYKHLNAELVSRALADGIRIVAWTIDDEQAIRQVAALHPSIMICTNVPDQWQRAFM